MSKQDLVFELSFDDPVELIDQLYRNSKYFFFDNYCVMYIPYHKDLDETNSFVHDSDNVYHVRFFFIKDCEHRNDVIEKKYDELTEEQKDWAYDDDLFYPNDCSFDWNRRKLISSLTNNEYGKLSNYLNNVYDLNDVTVFIENDVRDLIVRENMQVHTDIQCHSDTLRRIRDHFIDASFEILTL